MATYDADLQAAVDGTSVAHDAGEEDLAAYLRLMLAERGLETADDAWVQRTVEGITRDRNYLIESEPDDFVPNHPERD